MSDSTGFRRIALGMLGALEGAHGSRVRAARGRQGCTRVRLEVVDEETLGAAEALSSRAGAYEAVSPGLSSSTCTPRGSTS